MADDPAPLAGGRLILGAVTLALANFIVVLDTTIANVSVPHIAGALAVSPTQGTWTITSYAVADAICVPLTGWLAARYGSVRWLLVSLVGFGVFSLMCGLSRSLGMLVVFRILQGLSGGPLMPLTQTLLLRIFPKGRGGIGIGIWAMTTTVAPIVGPILGGVISDNWSWPWIFFINLPVVVLCFFAVSQVITPYETPTRTMKLDRVGLALLVIFVSAFQIMLDIGRDHDWFGSPIIVALAIIAAIGFAAFVIWEWTEPDPVVDIRVFRHRGFAAATVAVSLTFGAFFAIVVLTPLWLQQVVGYTATQAGYTVAWTGVFSVLMSPLAGRLVGKVDLRLTVSLSMVWMAVTMILRLGWTDGADYWTLSFPQLLQGFGMPFFFVGATALALASVTPRELVSAAGIGSFLRTLSGAIGTAIATTTWEDASRRARGQLVPRLNDPGGAFTTLKGAGLSEEQARGVLDRLVELQSLTLGALHVFAVAGVVLVIAAAALWLAPRVRPAGGGGGGH